MPTNLPSHPLAPYLALWHTPGIGPIRFFKLIEHFPNIEQLFETPVLQLTSLGIPETIAQALQKPNWRNVEQDLTWSNQSSQHLISWKDKHYPAQLKEIADPPPFLFIKGDASLLCTPQIAIIGSRKPTPSGIESAKIFTKHLSAAGLTITSGLALGIDAASHQSALHPSPLKFWGCSRFHSPSSHKTHYAPVSHESDAYPAPSNSMGVDHHSKTIGVLGTGIDQIYPSCHKKLADQIIECGGALVSDFPLGTPPKAENFPRRNRIISGLSLGTLVIEATLKSGSLITARLANEQGREVFAIPGSIHNPQSKGCHLLIQQGAKLTQTPQDILEELCLQHSFSPSWEKSPPCTRYGMPEEPAPETFLIGGRMRGGTKNSLDAHSQLLLECVGFEKTSVDQLIERTNLPTHIVSSIALQLELKGLIAAISGGYLRVKERV